MQKTAFHECLSFFAEKKSILELNAQKPLLRASKNTNSGLVQLSKLRECEATDAQKLLLSQKKLLNVILRAKLNSLKNVSF